MQKNKTQTAQHIKKLIILMFVQNFGVLAVLWGPLELILMRIKKLQTQIILIYCFRRKRTHVVVQRVRWLPKYLHVSWGTSWPYILNLVVLIKSRTLDCHFKWTMKISGKTGRNISVLRAGHAKWPALRTNVSVSILLVW